MANEEDAPEKGFKSKDYGTPGLNEWNEEMEDQHIRNLYKADKFLSEVVYQQNMFMIANQHYTYLNQSLFVTPSIVITSAASFMSFMAAAHPEDANDISLFVGFLGTLATIVTALQVG